MEVVAGFLAAYYTLSRKAINLQGTPQTRGGKIRTYSWGRVATSIDGGGGRGLAYIRCGINRCMQVRAPVLP